MTAKKKVIKKKAEDEVEKIKAKKITKEEFESNLLKLLKPKPKKQGN